MSSGGATRFRAVIRARLVRIRGSVPVEGSRFWFATAKVRARPVAPYQKSCFPYVGFQVFAVVSTGNLATLVMPVQITIGSDAQYSPDLLECLRPYQPGKIVADDVDTSRLKKSVLR